MTKQIEAMQVIASLAADKVIDSKEEAVLREALAEQFCDNHCTWLDHHPDCDKAEQPAQREWVGLTDEDIKDAVRGAGLSFTAPDVKVARAIEAKLKENNT